MVSPENTQLSVTPRWGDFNDELVRARSFHAFRCTDFVSLWFIPHSRDRRPFTKVPAPGCRFPVPWPHDAAARTLHPLPGPAQCPSPVQRENGPPQNVDLLECLRGLPIEKLYEATRVLTDDSPANAWFPYYPVLEGELTGHLGTATEALACGLRGRVFALAVELLLTCLSGLPTGEWEPETEGGPRAWLDVRPSERITRGSYAKVPVVMGSVDDEGTRFIRPDIAEGQDEFLEVVKGAVPECEVLFFQDRSRGADSLARVPFLGS